MSNDAYVRINLKTDAAKALAKYAMYKATSDLMNLDVVPEAQKETPVLTGTNRRSIDAVVGETPEGKIKAVLYTSSGYGGYLETGTARMKAQPYLGPAWDKFSHTLSKRIQQVLKLVKVAEPIPAFVEPEQGPNPKQQSLFGRARVRFTAIKTRRAIKRNDLVKKPKQTGFKFGKEKKKK